MPLNDVRLVGGRMVPATEQHRPEPARHFIAPSAKASLTLGLLGRPRLLTMRV